MKINLFDIEFFVTEIVLSCFVKPGHESKVHRNRSSHGFAYNLQGEKEYRFDDGTVLHLHENELIYLPQNSTYTVDTIMQGGCYAINFMLNRPICAEPFVIPLPQTDVLGCFVRSEQAFREQQNGYKQSCCKEVYEIACQIQRKQSNHPYIPANQRKIVTKAEQYIGGHYTDDKISLKTLAEHCGVSEVYLRRIFKITHGCSPVAYINALRLSYASALLLSGEYSVTEVCYMSGFNNPSYFSRSYKAKYGTAPSRMEQ